MWPPEETTQMLCLFSTLYRTNLSSSRFGINHNKQTRIIQMTDPYHNANRHDQLLSF